MNQGILRLKRISTQSRPDLVKLGYSFLQRGQFVVNGVTVLDKVIPIGSSWVSAWERFLGNCGLDLRTSDAQKASHNLDAVWAIHGEGADSRVYVAPVTAASALPPLFFCMETGGVHQRAEINIVEAEIIHF